jgi:hypothetical protein
LKLWRKNFERKNEREKKMKERKKFSTPLFRIKFGLSQIPRIYFILFLSHFVDF